MAHTDSSNTSFGQAKIREMYTRVFYNSKYSATKNHHLLREHRVIANTHTKQRTNKATGMPIKTRPTTTNRDINATVTGKVGDTNQSGQCNPVRQVEVSVTPPSQTLDKSFTKITVTIKHRGTLMFTPAIESIASQENVLNTKCKLDIQNTSVAKVVTSKPKWENTIVSNASHKSLNDHSTLDQTIHHTQDVLHLLKRT